MSVLRRYPHVVCGVAALLATCAPPSHAALFSIQPATDRAGEREGVAPFVPLSESDADAQIRYWPALFPDDVSLESRFALEFALADLGPVNQIGSVRLALFPNAASFQGAASLDVTAYLGDGWISAADFNLGQTIAGPVVVTDLLPMVTDVTEFVAAAASGGQSHVGFVVRLHPLPSGEPPFVPFVPFATKEYPNAQFHPALLVEDTSVLRPGDATGDGRVDRADVAALVSALAATSGGPPLAADFDGDGQVSLGDLMTLQRSFDATSFAPAAAPQHVTSANNVPEPSPAALLVAALLASLAHHACRRIGHRPVCPACLVPSLDRA